MLLQDPNNKFDENAVSIRTLRGIDLGYVPRDFTEQLRGQGLHFARVLSIGQNEAQKWGAKIGALLNCACPCSLKNACLTGQQNGTCPHSGEQPFLRLARPRRSGVQADKHFHLFPPFCDRA